MTCLQPIAETVVRHRCPHCRRSYAHQTTAAKHMARCFRNPATRTCKTCRHLELGEYRYECAVDAMPQGPVCPQCGEGLDHAGECPNGHADKPLYHLAVLCDQWESAQPQPEVNP